MKRWIGWLVWMLGLSMAIAGCDGGSPVASDAAVPASDAAVIELPEMWCSITSMPRCPAGYWVHCALLVCDAQCCVYEVSGGRPICDGGEVPTCPAGRSEPTCMPPPELICD